MEICLRMSTDRADFRCLLANHNMSTVRTLPDHIPVSGKYQAALNVRQKLTVLHLILPLFLIQFCLLLQKQIHLYQQFLYPFLIRKKQDLILLPLVPVFTPLPLLKME